ncbi:MAG: M1 family peptidase [Burkholderiales bacterium]|nr:M1 family peptidase [Burkholderiales bacterium]
MIAYCRARRGDWWARALLALACLAAANVRAAVAPAHYDLEVLLDPAASTIEVRGTLRIPPGKPASVVLGIHAEQVVLERDGQALKPERTGPNAPWRWQLRARAEGPSSVRFAYVGQLRALDPALDHRQVLALTHAVAGADGAYLPASSAWYPQVDAMPVTYRLGIAVPAGFRAVSSGTLVQESLSAPGVRAVFESPGTVAGIDLIAGPYRVTERMLMLGAERSVRVRTYFHAELQALAEGYLDSAARYIERYDRAIGSYAYAAYNIVSAPLPAGFGMPGIAYLGREVIRLPFIRATSLGHEVLHDWWGNGVYPDYAHGNWAEGLTTFLADYAFQEDAGAGAARAMRLGWLRDYAAVPAEQDRALTTFVSRRHGSDQILGYNKTAFVFFMLRDRIGAERFDAALRRFWSAYRGQTAGWMELEHVFEALADAGLRDFFRQWLERKGAPAIELVFARRLSGSGSERIDIAVRQSAPHYRLRVPIRVHLENGDTIDAELDLHAVQARLRLDLPARARAVSLDPDFRIFRRLDPEEIAPILRQVMLDPRTRVVASTDPPVRAAALALAQATLEQGARGEAAVTEVASPLMIVGLHAEVGAMLERLRLPGVPAKLRQTERAYAYAGRAPDGRNFLVASAPDVASLAALARALPHLGAQSYALFEGARSIERGVWPASAPRVPVTGP